MLFKQLTDLGNLGIRQKLEIEQVMQCLVGREAGNIRREISDITNVAWLLIRYDCIFISIHFSLLIQLQCEWLPINT